MAACKQLLRLSKARIVARALNLDENSTKASQPPTPKQFLTRIVLKTPVPLWMPSCKARGISHAVFGQCTEYFELMAGPDGVFGSQSFYSYCAMHLSFSLT